MGTPTPPEETEYEAGHPYLGQDGEVYLRSWFGTWRDSQGQDWEDVEMEDKLPLLQMFTKEFLLQEGWTPPGGTANSGAGSGASSES